MIPDSVFTLTITASRLTARPMPRRTLLSLGRGNDVGIAVISAILRAASNLGKGEFMASARPIWLPDHSKAEDRRSRMFRGRPRSVTMVAGRHLSRHAHRNPRTRVVRH